MRKIALTLCLFVTAALVWPYDAQAIFRRRARYCPPAPCYVIVPICPPVAAPTAPVVVTPKGRKLTVIDRGEQGIFVERARPTATGKAKPKHEFAGQHRGAAKTSITNAPLESFADLASFIATLPGDVQMRMLGIGVEWESDRVMQEKRNVEVNAFIYAVKFEHDHDYHVIIGNDPADPDVIYFNVEVSGLPEEASPHRATLDAARTTFESFFSQMGVTLKSSYVKFPEGIPVRLRGSLFFDVDHPAGVVGPLGMRPQTAWEIHPVTGIEFEP
jgi:hypothetical protein